MLIPEKDRFHWANRLLNEILQTVQGILALQNKLHTIHDALWKEAIKRAVKRETRIAPKYQCLINNQKRTDTSQVNPCVLLTPSNDLRRSSII